MSPHLSTDERVALQPLVAEMKQAVLGGLDGCFGGGSLTGDVDLFDAFFEGFEVALVFWRGDRRVAQFFQIRDEAMCVERNHR